MLVCKIRLTLALLFQVLLTVVPSARSQAGLRGSSEGLEFHATKNSFRNHNQSAKSQNGSSVMAKDSNSASGNSSFRNNSVDSFNASESWTANSSNSSSSMRNSNRKNGDSDDLQDRTSTSLLSEDIQVGCKELRARSYITDGFCTSEKPVMEVVCAGHCLPIMELPWYAAFVKTLASSKLKDYQCVEDVVRKKKVKLLCKNGAPRHYIIKVVKSCKCKKITNKHNKTSQKKKRRRKEPKSKTAIGS